MNANKNANTIKRTARNKFPYFTGSLSPESFFLFKLFAKKKNPKAKNPKIRQYLRAGEMFLNTVFVKSLKKSNNIKFSIFNSPFT